MHGAKKHGIPRISISFRVSCHSVEEREQQETAESYTTTIITNAILRQIMFG